MTNALTRTLIPLAAVSLLACGSKSASSSQADASGPPASAAASSGAVDASFSATIDGVAVSGHGTDEMQMQNAAFVLPRQGAGDKYGMFSLYSITDGQDTKADYSLTFHFPPRAGTYVHAGSYESCKCDLILNKHIAQGDFARYMADTVTITITSMSATRVAGTFSGTFKLSVDTPRAAQKRAQVTNGKFDIPVSTSNMTPE